MKLLIYIPAFNEEKNIGGVLSELPDELEAIDEIKYLVIDDGSTDQTAGVARSHGAEVISHPVNKGVGAAFHSAVDYALENGADILVGIDADRQFDPAEISNLIEPIIEENADMVIGNRFRQGKPENMPTAKYLGNVLISKMINFVTGETFQDVSCGFRSYSREALFHFNLFGQFTYTHETILSLSYKGLLIKERNIAVRYYKDRKSRVASSLFRYASRTIKIITRSILDYKPLKFLGLLAGILILIAICLETVLFVHYFLTGSFTPYKSLGFIGLGFGFIGIMTLFIGLITDILNRMRINQDKILYEMKKSKYD